MITSKFFDMGKIAVTYGINAAVKESNRFALEVGLCLKRYAVMDWGCLNDEDKQANENALNCPDDLYLLAVYETCNLKVE